MVAIIGTQPTGASHGPRRRAERGTSTRSPDSRTREQARSARRTRAARLARTRPRVASVAKSSNSFARNVNTGGRHGPARSSSVAANFTSRVNFYVSFAAAPVASEVCVQFALWRCRQQNRIEKEFLFFPVIYNCNWKGKWNCIDITEIKTLSRWREARLDQNIGLVQLMIFGMWNEDMGPSEMCLGISEKSKANLY